MIKCWVCKHLCVYSARELVIFIWLHGYQSYFCFSSEFLHTFLLLNCFLTKRSIMWRLWRKLSLREPELWYGCRNWLELSWLFSLGKMWMYYFKKRKVNISYFGDQEGRLWQKLLVAPWCAFFPLYFLIYLFVINIIIFAMEIQFLHFPAFFEASRGVIRRWFSGKDSGC